MTLTQAFEQTKQRINIILKDILSTPQPSISLQNAMVYAVENGGKRLRPFLVYQCAHLLGMDHHPYIDKIAAAIELIHSYSLVHDDLPDMDNSPLRRGKPSCWKHFNVTTAILAGDALQPLAFEILCAPESIVLPLQQLAIIHLIAQSSGAQGMVAGQMMDMFPNSVCQEDELRLTQSLKTGKLIEAACLAPAILKGVGYEDQTLWKSLAGNLGLMYQIMDDILDETSSQEKLGKPIGQDYTKITFVKLIGLTRSRSYLWDLHQQNVSILEKLGNKDHILALFSKAIAEEKIG